MGGHKWKEFASNVARFSFPFASARPGNPSAFAEAKVETLRVLAGFNRRRETVRAVPPHKNGKSATTGFAATFHGEVSNNPESESARTIALSPACRGRRSKATAGLIGNGCVDPWSSLRNMDATLRGNGRDADIRARRLSRDGGRALALIHGSA